MKKLSIIAIILASLAIAGEAFIFATRKEDNSDEILTRAIRADYRVYAPPMPDTLYFCGERVPLNLWYVREGLDRACRPMELNTTWYFQKQAPEGVLDYIDTLTIWTWHHEALVDLKENYERLEEQTPKHKKILGIYMYDFDAGVPIPDEYMAMQCEFGLDMLKQGRVDGLMFETNSTMGLGFESEKFLVDWIDKVKNTKVPD